MVRITCNCIVDINMVSELLIAKYKAISYHILQYYNNIHLKSNILLSNICLDYSILSAEYYAQAQEYM